MIRANCWRPNEDEYVRTHWHISTDAEMAKVLSRTPGAVNTRRSHLGLYRKAPPKGGTLASDIGPLWGTMPPSEIAQTLGCSESRVRDVAAARGMGPSNFRKPSQSCAQNPAVRPSGPRGYTADEIDWAKVAAGHHPEADLILRMDAEGKLMVAG